MKSKHSWDVSEKGFPHSGRSDDKLRYLLRYAVLAPSSHNTQPWKFCVHETEIRVFVDKTRWLKVADTDERELYISVGCASENLLMVAEHFGYGHEVAYFPEPNNAELVAIVELLPGGQPSHARDPALFNAVPVRHTNHKVYEKRPIPNADLQRLKNCCVEDGIRLHLFDDFGVKQKVNDLVMRGDAILFSDPAYRQELGHWFGQGVFGTPWLNAKLGQLVIRYINMGTAQGKKDSKALMSAPMLAALSSRANDKQSRVKVGQVFERICLTATLLGIRVHPMSQILQLPKLTTDVGWLIPIPEAFPQHFFRLGYAKPEKKHTPRRPLEDVLI